MAKVRRQQVTNENSASEAPEMKIEAETMKNYVAFLAVGPSTVRNQGGAGVVSAARQALVSVNLERFNGKSEENFCSALDAATDEFGSKLPPAARSWGLSRKVVNIYLRHCFYNTLLNVEYSLEKAESFFEIPMDRVVADHLHQRDLNGILPRWKAVKSLTPSQNKIYQQFALHYAAERSTARVHLDAVFWTDRPGAV